MTVRAIALGLLLLVASAFTASAQMDALARSTPEQRAKFQTEFMKDRLSLTSEQLPKVSALNLKYAQEMDPVLKSQDRPLMRMRSMQAIQQRKDAELATLLTPDQNQRYLASKEELREKLEQKVAEKAAAGGS